MLRVRGHDADEIIFTEAVDLDALQAEVCDAGQSETCSRCRQTVERTSNGAVRCTSNGRRWKHRCSKGALALQGPDARRPHRPQRTSVVRGRGDRLEGARESRKLHAQALAGLRQVLDEHGHQPRVQHVGIDVPYHVAESAVPVEQRVEVGESTAARTPGISAVI